jgi:hypothetical protein
MSLRSPIRRIFLFLPLLALVFISALPRSSARLSLLLHGMPFAHVTKDDVFNYVKMDNMRNAGIVVSEGQAVGWIYQPMFGFARFIRFTGTPALEVSIDDWDLWTEAILPRLWLSRWWLLPIQAVVLLLWLRQREKKLQHSTR